MTVDINTELCNFFNKLLMKCETTQDIETIVQMRYNHLPEIHGNLISKNFQRDYLIKVKLDLTPNLDQGQINYWKGYAVMTVASKSSDIDMVDYLTLAGTPIKCCYTNVYNSKKISRGIYNRIIYITLSSKHFPYMKNADEKHLMWNALSKN